MRIGPCGRHLALALLVFVAGAAQARRGQREPLRSGSHVLQGTAGPAWMQPDKPTRVGARQTSPKTADVNITNNTSDDTDPCWSADGNLIAFASNRNGSYDIFICRTDGSNPDTGAANSPKLISGLTGVERYPAFSPGGTELAYIRDSGIYVRNLRTGVESLVSDQVGQPKDLVFSYDGQRLAFTSRIGADLASNLYWISLDSNNRSLTKITDSTTDATHPSWFPRSDKIIFASKLDAGRSHIYQVDVQPPASDGTVGPGVPDTAWTLKVGTLGSDDEQKDPAWVNQGGVTGNANFPITSPANYHILYAEKVAGTNHYDLKLIDQAGTPAGGLFIYTDATATAPGNQALPFGNPVQTASNNLCVYRGDQSGNGELYTITIYDVSPPVLSDGSTAKLPSVTPQKTFPGATVKISAPLFDRGSGVAEVWAVIRRAEVPVFQRNSIYTGIDADEGVLNSNGTDRWAEGANNIEYEQMVINASTYGNVSPLLGGVTSAGLQNWVRNVGLKLTLEPNQSQDVLDSGNGIWSANWVTPATAQDFYVDIIAFDKRGNVPVDTDLSFNSRPGGGDNELAWIQNGFSTPYYVIGYDHVCGFTTRQLDLTRKILFVSDYGCGQKFQVADFAGNDQASLNRFWPAALPVEHWYFYGDDSNTPVTAARADQCIDPNYTGAPMFLPVGNAPTLSGVYNPWLGSNGPRVPGWESADIAMVERARGNCWPYAGRDQADIAAVWRILCRGPVDASTLNAFTPLPLEQPAGTPIPAQDADRMVLWVAPYLGDLFVQAGTLLDADVQNALTSFVSAGGRLFVTGQDVAWALTKNGIQSNSFLASILRASFVSDAAADVQGATVQTAVQRRIMNPSAPMTGVEQALFTGRPVSNNPITRDLYVDFFYGWPRGEYHPADSADGLIRLLGGWYGDWAGDGCPNGWFIDDVNPINGGLETLRYANGGASAMVRYIDTSTGGRTVFCAYPFEATRNNFRYYPGYWPNQNWIVGHAVRTLLFSGVSDYIRTGGLLGKVVGPDGSTPMGGVRVVAKVGPAANAQVMATTTSLADGTYLLRGMSTGNYAVYVVSDEYTADHRPYQPVFGGQTSTHSDLTIRLLRFETGTVFGKVTRAGDGTTVAGAKVTVTLQTTGSNPLTKTINTDNNGQYSIDVPGGTYTVTAEASGFGAASKTNVVIKAGDKVQVDLVLQPSPGTLAGTVKGTNQPVSGAGIAIQKAGVTVATATTGNGGDFSTKLAAGTYDLVVTASGFQQASQTGVAIVSDQTTTVSFDLTAVPPGSLLGLVTLQGSTDPVGGVTVNLVSGGAILKSTTTAATTSTSGTYTYNYKIDEVPAGTYDVQISATGYSSTPRTGVVVESGKVTSGINFALQPLHTFIQGVSMTSTPYDYASVAPDAMTLINDDPTNASHKLKLAAYDALARGYVFYPNSPANTFRLGLGYFMKLAKNVPLTRQGVTAPTTGNGYDLPLLSGWNLIGHVYEFPVDLYSCKVIYQQAEYSVQDASARGLISAVLYTLNFNQYQQVFRLDPYTGYWARAYQNVTLRVPPTSMRTATETGRQARTAPEGGRWLVDVQATCTSGLASTGSFGVAPESGEVYDANDRAQPPRPPVGGFIEVAFPHSDWGRFSDRYRNDVRARRSTMRWLMEVTCDRGGEEVQLTWPQLNASLPADVRLVIEDLETGARRSMRHVATYRYKNAAPGGSRQFAIDLLPAGSRPQVTNVGYSPGRGGGGIVTYTLSAPLTMTVDVRGPSGAVIRRLVRSESRANGTQSVTWDGRDEQGRPLPNGVYSVVVVGVSDTGEQVREVRAIQYRR